MNMLGSPKNKVVPFFPSPPPLLPQTSLPEQNVEDEELFNKNLGLSNSCMISDRLLLRALEDDDFLPVKPSQPPFDLTLPSNE
jgi:hypothetical protein